MLPANYVQWGNKPDSFNRFQNWAKLLKEFPLCIYNDTAKWDMERDSISANDALKLSMYRCLVNSQKLKLVYSHLELIVGAISAFIEALKKEFGDKTKGCYHSLSKRIKIGKQKKLIIRLRKRRKRAC